MKRTIKGVLPFLLLVLALTFMTKYKQVEDLTDMETYEIRNFVENNAEPAEASASAEKRDTSVAHESVTDEGEEPGEDAEADSGEK